MNIIQVMKTSKNIFIILVIEDNDNDKMLLLYDTKKRCRCGVTACK